MPGVQPRRADLVVIGLGAMGAATAWRATRRGLTVIGLDASRPPHARGSTHGHSRIIREAYFEHPQYVPLVQRAYALWGELEAESSTRLFQATGGLMIGAPESAVVSGTLRAARAHDLRVQTWTRDEIRQRVPALVPAEGMVGVFEPRAGVLPPERAVTAMLARASAAGARLHTGEAAVEWLSAPGRVVVRTAAAEYEGRHLVIAAGAWTAHVSAGLALPLAVERQVQYWFATHDDPRFAAGGLPVFLVHTPEGRMLYGLPDQGQGLKLA
jgi:sarcosine oxidase